MEEEEGEKNEEEKKEAALHTQLQHTTTTATNTVRFSGILGRDLDEYCTAEVSQREQKKEIKRKKSFIHRRDGFSRLGLWTLKLIIKDVRLFF